MNRCRGAVRLRAGPVARTPGALDTIVAFGDFGIRSGEIPPFVFRGSTAFAGNATWLDEGCSRLGIALPDRPPKAGLFIPKDLEKFAIV